MGVVIYVCGRCRERRVGQYGSRYVSVVVPGNGEWGSMGLVIYVCGRFWGRRVGQYGSRDMCMWSFLGAASGAVWVS
jgi:hypothetical protein